MASINIDTIDAPDAIKARLRQLVRTVTIEKQSRKGANSWLFFGHHVIRDQRVAVKFYDWGGDPAFHAEPRCLAAIQSPNVIPVFAADQVDGDFAYFITPFFPRGDLDDELCKGIIGNLRAINFTRDLLSGLSHLHAEHLLHRDLKPENILVSDSDNAVIGDFGSVKRLPDGHSSVPGSGHSIGYRPPESVSSGQYAAPGDIYQAGLVLYQLLGGRFPYETVSWLGKRQLGKYHAIEDPVDRQVFANDCIKDRIVKGRVVDLSSLPPWVCVQARRTISKAVAVDPGKRYQSCAEVLARIGEIRPSVSNWRVKHGFPTRSNGTEFRIIPVPNSKRFCVQKRAGSQWRADNSFSPSSVETLVKQVEDRIR